MKDDQTSKFGPYWWFNEQSDEFMINMLDSMFKKPREIVFKWQIVDLLMKRDFNLYTPESLLRLLVVYVTFASSRENLLKHISPENFEFCQKKCTKIFGPDYLNFISRREDSNGEEEASLDMTLTKKDPSFCSNIVLLLCSQALITETKLDFAEIFKYIPTMYKVFIKFKVVHPKFVAQINKAAAKGNYDDFDSRMITIILYNSFKFPEAEPQVNQIELYKTLIKNKHKLGQLNSHQVLYILFSMRKYIYALDRVHRQPRQGSDIKVNAATEDIVRKMLIICTEIFLQKFNFWTFNSCSMILNEIVIKFKGIDITVWQQMKISSQLISMMVKEQSELNMVDLFNFATVYKTFIRRVDRTTVDDWSKIFSLLETKTQRMTTLDAKIFKVRLPRLLLNIEDVLNKSMLKSDPQCIEELKAMFKRLEQKYVKTIH